MDELLTRSVYHYVNKLLDEAAELDIPRKSAELLSTEEFFESSSEITTDVEFVDFFSDHLLEKKSQLKNNENIISLTENFVFNKPNSLGINEVVVFVARELYTASDRFGLHGHIYNEQLLQTVELKNNYNSAEKVEAIIIENITEKG